MILLNVILLYRPFTPVFRTPKCVNKNHGRGLFLSGAVNESFSGGIFHNGRGRLDDHFSLLVHKGLSQHANKECDVVTVAALWAKPRISAK